jgi:hypothetical protein
MRFATPKEIFTRVLTPALAFACLTCAAPSSFATTIDFETGAPCCFVDTTPLTTLYSGLGVTFSGIGGPPGSILDQSGGFGINARSGVDFLAFNTEFGTGTGDQISFSSPTSNFVLYVGDGTSASYTATAYNTLSQQIGTTTVTPAGGVYGELSLGFSDIAYVNVTSANGVWVADDLSFNTITTTATPLPAALPLFAGGLGVIGLMGRRRTRKNAVAIAASILMPPSPV